MNENRTDSVGAEERSRSSEAELLAEQGIRIARRTVAKYREMLGIPVARLRKQI